MNIILFPLFRLAWILALVTALGFAPTAFAVASDPAVPAPENRLLNERKATDSSNAFFLSTNTIPENWPAGSAIAVLRVADADAAVVRFELISGEGSDDNNAFRIDNQLLKAAIVFDRDVQSKYRIRLRATANDASIIEKSFILDVGGDAVPGPSPGATDSLFVSDLEIDGTVRAVAFQGDGKALIAGDFTMVHGYSRGGIARLHRDGKLDTAFAADLSGADAPVYSLVVLEDGRIMVGGSFTSINGQAANGIARLHGNGALDTSFAAGEAGIPDGLVYAMALQDDGKLVIAGSFAQVHGKARSSIARLSNDGRLDESFAKDLPGLGGSSPAAYAVALQKDGKILIGGTFTQIHGTARRRIVRLEEDGTLDGSFSSGSNDRVNAIAIQPDGKILIGVSSTELFGDRLVRFDENGVWDATFRPSTSAGGDIEAVVVQNDGKILVGGAFAWINTLDLYPWRSRIARLNPNGSLDTSYLSRGVDTRVHAITLTEDDRILIGGAFANVNGLPRQKVALLHGGNTPGNRAPTGIGLSRAFVFENRHAGVMVGNLTAVDPDFHDSHTFSLVEGIADNAHFSIDGTTLKTAASFQYDQRSSYTVHVRTTDSGGLFAKQIFTVSVYRNPGYQPGDVDLTFSPGEINGLVTSIARQPDGKWIIGGTFSNIGGVSRHGIARLHENGNLDSSFLNNLPGVSGQVHSVALQEDGKILIGGSFLSVNGHSRQHIARLNTDGTLDSTFVGPEFSFGQSSVSQIEVLESGRILMAGSFRLQINRKWYSSILRLENDGAVDPDFQLPSSLEQSVASFVLQKDDKILLAGSYQPPSGGPPYARIVRLDPDGAEDETFFGLPKIVGGLNSVALQEDGKIIIGGRFSIEDVPSGITRLWPDGGIDSSFASGLSGTAEIGMEIHSVAIESNGKILLGGTFTSIHGEVRSRIARLNADGTLDVAFGHERAGASGPVLAIALNSKILVGGGFTYVNGVPRNSLALVYANESSPPPVFAGYDAWATALPEIERAYTDDPGYHGIANLLRYAFDMDPVQPERTRLPRIGQYTAIEGEQDTAYLTLTYIRRTNDPALVYFVEASDDLTDWEPFHGHEKIVSTNKEGETETVTVTDTEPMRLRSNHFLRVRVKP